MLKKPISLDITDILNKIVVNNLGGYCFEHNQLMYCVLESLGFNVRILVARVINNQDIDTPRTHRITLLEFNNEQYIVDVGFGAMCPSIPIKINSSSNNENYRIIQNKDSDYQLELLRKKSYFSLYKFNLVNYTHSDCVMGNFYSSHHPNAVFVNNFLISLIFPNITLSLRNNKYYKIDEDKTEIIDIQNDIQLCLILNNDFNVAISEEDCSEIWRIL